MVRNCTGGKFTRVRQVKPERRTGVNIGGKFWSAMLTTNELPRLWGSVGKAREGSTEQGMGDQIEMPVFGKMESLMPPTFLIAKKSFELRQQGWVGHSIHIGERDADVARTRRPRSVRGWRRWRRVR